MKLKTRKPSTVFRMTLISLVLVLLSTSAAWAGTVSRVTYETPDQLNPTVSGSRIVWEDNRLGTQSEIYTQVIGGSVARVTNFAGNDAKPRIDGNIVVFERWPAQGGIVPNPDIWMHNFSTGAASAVSANSNTQYSPDVSGNRIVWFEFNGFSRWDIMLKDLTTGQIYNLSRGNSDSLYPRISNNIVVWADDRNGKTDIYYYNLAADSDGDGVPNYRDGDRPANDPAEVRVTTDPGEQNTPDIDSGKIVWSDYRIGSFDIYMYDLNAPGLGQQRLTDGGSWEIRPTISGNRVVWVDWRNGNYVDNTNPDIYSLNLSTRLVTRLVKNDSLQHMPDLSGNRLVMHDSRGGQFDIYRFDFDNVAPTPPAKVYASNTLKGRELKVWWNPAPVDDVDTYIVYRRPEGGKWAQLKQVSTLKIYDRGLANGKRYYYKVKATDTSGNIGKVSAAVASAVPTDKTAPPAPAVRSSTHPSQSKWFKNNDPIAAWTPPADNSGIRGYSFIFDRVARTAPDMTIDTAGLTKSWANRVDGIWYFHIRARDRSGNWGLPAHFRIRIDTRKPKVKAVSPAKDAVGVSRKPSITLQFNEVSNILRTSLNDSSFFLLDENGNQVPAALSYTGSTRTATLVPGVTLRPRSTYSVRATSDIIDFVALRFGGYSWSFRTGK